MSNEHLIELASEVERLKQRVARLERGQAILVVTTGELDSLALNTARSHSECLYALRETSGSMEEAAAFLRAMPAHSGKASGDLRVRAADR